MASLLPKPILLCQYKNERARIWKGIDVRSLRQGYARLLIRRRPSKIIISGTLFSHCFDILFSRRRCAHRCRIAYGGIPAEAIQFPGYRARIPFADNFLVDSRRGGRPVSYHEPV